jgi:hypothetical protein
VRKQTWAIGAVGGAVVAAVLLTLLFSKQHPTAATHAGEVILIILGTLLTIAAISLFVLSFQEVPRLRIGPVEVAMVPVRQQETPDTDAYEVASLHIVNAPKKGASTARGVYVRLNFHRAADGGTVQSLWARWSHAPHDSGNDGTALASQVDIPAHGVPLKIDVVGQRRGDAELHAIGASFGFSGGQGMPLWSQAVVVNVIARGANAKSDSAWFDIVNEAPGSTLQLVPRGRPSWWAARRGAAGK